MKLSILPSKTKIELLNQIKAFLPLNRCLELENSNPRTSEDRCKICYQHNSVNFDLNFKIKSKIEQWENFNGNTVIQCLGPDCKNNVHKICFEHAT